MEGHPITCVINLWLRAWSHLTFRVGFAVAVLGVLIGIVYMVESGEGSCLPPCIFHEMTGLHCPGCGNTRALRALAHGDVLVSLRCNLLLLPGIAMIMALCVAPRLSQRRGLSFTVLVVVLLFSLLRNLPWVPFTYLAPL